MEGRGMVNSGMAGVGTETAQERAFDALIKRLMRANVTLAEARARLDAFSDRLSGAVPQQINSNNTKDASPPNTSVEARLIQQIDNIERQENELHSLIERLERIA